ncbi:hypothetical protein SARC_16693, partial [Sphaeroforma arctica JP610]
GKGRDTTIVTVPGRQNEDVIPLVGGENSSDLDLESAHQPGLPPGVLVVIFNMLD